MLKIHTFALAALAMTSSAQAATIIYSDDFNDNTITGWTFLDRNGATEIANAEWTETGGVLEQSVTNFDFVRDTTPQDPMLGAIALSGSGTVGGTYTISLTMDSLENANNFQDQVVVFGYENADNFNYLEFVNSNTVNGRRANLNTVIAGQRSTPASRNITFNQGATDVSLVIDSAAGEVVVTYDGNVLPTFETGGTLTFAEGQNGVGSNNDAFTIDNFQIEQAIPEPSSVALLSIAGLSLLRRRR